MSTIEHTGILVSSTDVDAIFKHDDENGFMLTQIDATTENGSIYEVKLLGPVVEGKFGGKTIKVRSADFRRTRPGGLPQFTRGRYVGFESIGDEKHLIFLTSLNEDVDDLDHTSMGSPMSAPLQEEMHLSLVNS